jgi:tRNA G18 (ribose-2'-O)-methylase SpoU
MRGYFEIGVYFPKHEVNVGTLWRSAYQLGAAGIFVIGPRFRDQVADTTKAWRHIPLRVYPDMNTFIAAAPYAAPIVGIEMGGVDLRHFAHPERAIYLLGAEDNGLPPAVQSRCAHIVAIEALRTESYNVAVAGSIVMWHRQYGATA